MVPAIVLEIYGYRLEVVAILVLLLNILCLVPSDRTILFVYVVWAGPNSNYAY